MTTGRINQIAIDERNARGIFNRASIACSERAVETAPTREGGSHRSTLIEYGHRETWGKGLKPPRNRSNSILNEAKRQRPKPFNPSPAAEAAPKS